MLGTEMIRAARVADTQATKEAKRIASAFEKRPITGYDVAMWQINEKLSKWDGAFAIGFTSYQAMLRWTTKMHDSPIDPVREMLIRLYKIQPTFPIHLTPPSMQLMVDYLFDLRQDSAHGPEARKRCASLLAVLLGKNRGSGYRWARAAASAGKSAQVPVLRLCSKLFSMQEKTARTDFWRAAFAMADARGENVDAIREILDANGVVID